MKIVENLFIATVVLVFALIGYAIYLGWDVRRWDARIDALCAANGGRDVATRVYETAVAPETKEYFAQVGPQKHFRIAERREGITLGSLFPYVMETRTVEVLRDRDPSVVKFVERIVRVSDNKVLAERFGYQRAGGGLPSPDPTTNYRCPIQSDTTGLDTNVFLNHPHRHKLEKQ